MGAPVASNCACVKAAQPGVEPQRSQHASGLGAGWLETSSPTQSLPDASSHFPAGAGGDGPGLPYPETTLSSEAGESHPVFSQQCWSYFALNVHAVHPPVEPQSAQHACALATDPPDE